MSILLTIIFLLFIFIIGFCIANIINNENFLLNLGLSFLLGTTLFTVCQIFLLQYFYVEITAINILVVSAILALIGLTLINKQYSSYITHVHKLLSTYKKTSKVNKILISLISAVIINSFIQNYFWPITDWDALALYDFRARVVAEEGNFNKGFELGYFFQYPPYTSLLHTDLYIFGFERVKIWYSTLFTSTLIVFYALLRLRTTQTLSLVGTLLLAVNPMFLEHSVMAYTNLAFSAYLSLGLLFYIHWCKSKKESDLLLGNILIAGSTWIRMAEAFWIIPVLFLSILCIVYIKKRESYSTFFMALFGILLIFFTSTIWQTYISYLENIITVPTITNTNSTTITQNSLGNIPIIGVYLELLERLVSTNVSVMVRKLFDVLIYFKNNIFIVFGAYVIPFTITAVHDFKKGQIKRLPIYVFIALYCAFIFFGTFLFSIHYESWDRIGGSAARMSMFLIPLFIYTIFSSEMIKNVKK